MSTKTRRTINARPLLAPAIVQAMVDNGKASDVWSRLSGPLSEALLAIDPTDGAPACPYAAKARGRLRKLGLVYDSRRPAVTWYLTEAGAAVAKAGERA